MTNRTTIGGLEEVRPAGEGATEGDLGRRREDMPGIGIQLNDC